MARGRGRVTSTQIRNQLNRCAAGLQSDWTVSLNPEISHPRVYDDRTNFAVIKEAEWYGSYIIYSPDWHQRSQTGGSRIQYIGKGWIDARLRAHLNRKRKLRALSKRIELKFVAVSWAELGMQDENAAWLCEQILLLEHRAVFGDLPQSNQRGPSKEVTNWRSVLRWSRPGPRALMTRYGG